MKRDEIDHPYGCELILDLCECDTSTFNRKSIKGYFAKICEAIDMERCALHFWDDFGVAPEEQQTDPRTTGTSAVQFILTSSIVVHALDLLACVYVNIFSCKPFDKAVAENLTKEWFGGEVCRATMLDRE